MRIAEFLATLPTLFEYWGTTTMCPRDDQFEAIAAQTKSGGAGNLLQLIQTACGYLEPGEVLCEVGCLAGGNLIAALKENPDVLAYGIDFYATNDEAVDARLAELMSNLEKFEVLERVAFSHTQPTDFFQELRESGIEDRFGLLVYNFEPDYRQVLISLLQGSQWCADQAVIVVTHTDNQTVRQAVGDFLALTNEAMVAIDWQGFGQGAFGCQGLGVIAFDRRGEFQGGTPVVVVEKAEVTAVPAIESVGNKKKVLHVGCGSYHPEALPVELRTEEWQEVRLDINPAVNPDILGTITDLSAVPDESMDAVYSSHNIEHIYAYEVPLALQEFKRVLKPGGKAVITCPDIQAVAVEVAKGNLEETLYVSSAGPIAAIDILYGLGTDLARGNFYMAHKTAFTVETLRNKLLAAGFNSVEMRQEGLNLWAIANC